MSHLDPSSLATYNSLSDPHLQSYFSNERIRSHLKHAGLISGRGEIIADGEYRSRLARREHDRHVRHVLAENIVNRAIDMERVRQAEMKRQYEMIARAASVNNMKESKKRIGSSSGLLVNLNDVGSLSLDLSCSQMRPKGANPQHEMDNEGGRIPRLQSTQFSDDQRITYSSNILERRRRRRRRSSQQIKTSNKKQLSSTQRPHSSNKYSDSFAAPSCQITMVYYGPHTKVDYDHLVFEQIDEVIVMQQHCGGENLIVYKSHLKPGAEFTFESHRHSDYPFGLSLYVKGLIDSRISTCCEYKHRHGVKLGGDRGHFAIKSVHGSKPCVRCVYEKEARLKRYAQSPKEIDDENKMPIMIALPVSDETKTKETSVIIPILHEAKARETSTIIPVQHTSISNIDNNYSEDFDDLDDLDIQKKTARDGDSTNSSHKQLHKREQTAKSSSSKPKVFRRTSLIARDESSSIKSNSDFERSAREKSSKKTWQIIFHGSTIQANNSQKEKNYVPENSLLKFSFIGNNQKEETKMHEINMKQLSENLDPTKSNSFPIIVKNIEKPVRIRLKIHTLDNDDNDDEDDFNWYLNYIEIIDPETESHLRFPCKQWIKQSEEKILQLSQDVSRVERHRTTSNNSSRSSSNEKDHQQSIKSETKGKPIYRSRTSSNTSKQSKTNFDSARRNSIDNQSNQSEKTTSRNDLTDQEIKNRYRVTIYPSHGNDGRFNPNPNSRIFLCLNSQTREMNIKNEIDQLCPEFDSGVKKVFEVDLIQNINEKPERLTIGYANSDPTAKTWNIEKIVLLNIKTGDETTFPCDEILVRNESTLHAQKTFSAQLQYSSEDDTPRNKKINHLTSEHESQIKVLEKQQKNDDDDDDNNNKIKNENKQRSPSIKNMHDENDGKKKSKERSPSFQSMNDSDADYRTIFTKLDPDNELRLGSTTSSPSPRFSRQNDIQQENTKHIVDPLVGLDSLTDPTPRSTDQLNQNSSSHRTIDNAQNRLKSSHRTTNDNDDDD
ncbi:unnamed protein product [Rotaria socialis]|uniref:PLAT domain-containing protein n=1 Tax=Rotaria socialis TaxID=392032 RepID=A0A818E8V9_9BILA|nr:unnamed protein product [Rotaria socialis]CAF4688661.1 unnamed protein product [Rotaria socialis]